MSGLVSRVIIFMVAGVLAGLVTWVVSDLLILPLSAILPGVFSVISNDAGHLSAHEYNTYLLIFASWGTCIALFLTLAESLLTGVRIPVGRLVGISLLVGILAGFIGGHLGMAFFGPLYVSPTRTPVDFLRNVIARGLGWAIIGALAGTAPGWVKWSPRVGRNGFIGGLIGGMIGGATFEILPYLLIGLSSPGIASRLFGFAITGAMIGLFIALVNELLKEAWIRVVIGRNEGKEFLIEKQETRIGRFELSDIPLFGDPSVARTHAILAAAPGGQFTVRDTGESESGVLVNGQRISSEIPVKNGDQIQLGNKLLVFYERLTREPTVATPKDVAPSRPVDSGLPSLADLPKAETTSGVWNPSVRPQTSQASRTIMVGNNTTSPGGTPSRLMTSSGPHAGTTFLLRAGAVIGRDPNADIAIPNDSKASRSHARIVSDISGGYAVEDAGSTNGTFVNGQRISRQSLSVGDTIVIGGTSLRLE
jgi:pSer/pThr/pTyr-binding forkhead associated (FHA) protein